MTPIEIGNVLAGRFKSPLRFLPDPKAFHPTLSYHALWGPPGAEYSEVGWNPVDGLEALLHEYGHAKHRHRGDSYQFTSPAAYAGLLKNEHDAWMAAEEFAHEFGVPFDYAKAEDAYRTYTNTPEGFVVRLTQRDAPFEIAWAYKDGGAK